MAKAISRHCPEYWILAISKVVPLDTVYVVVFASGERVVSGVTLDERLVTGRLNGRVGQYETSHKSAFFQCD